MKSLQKKTRDTKACLAVIQHEVFLWLSLHFFCSTVAHQIIHGISYRKWLMHRVCETQHKIVWNSSKNTIMLFFLLDKYNTVWWRKKVHSPNGIDFLQCSTNERGDTKVLEPSRIRQRKSMLNCGNNNRKKKNVSLRATCIPLRCKWSRAKITSNLFCCM